MSEPADGPGAPLLGRHRTGNGGYRRVVGAHRAPGSTTPTRGYLFTVALLAGTASMPILAAISAGSATVGSTALPDSGVPFIPTPSVGPVVVPIPTTSQPALPPARPSGSPSAVSEWSSDFPLRRPNRPDTARRPDPPDAAHGVTGSGPTHRPAAPVPHPTRTTPHPPTTSPTPSVSPTPSPTPTPSVSPTPTASPTGAPTTTPSPSGTISVPDTEPTPTPTAGDTDPTPGGAPEPTSTPPA